MTMKAQPFKNNVKMLLICLWYVWRWL